MKKVLFLLLVITSINGFSSELIVKRSFKSTKSTKSILKKILKKESKGSFIVESKLETSLSFNDMQEFHLTDNSWYPDFCDEFTNDENIKKCSKKLKKILPSSKFGYLYINGDSDSSDFKVIHIIYTKKDKKTHYKLTIQDERN